MTQPPPQPPRITELHVENYRALRALTLKQLTPLTALVGPNGSGKSTVLDVMAFLSECFSEGLRKAWDRRSRMHEVRSRGSTGPIVIRLKYRERERTPLITYRLAIGESNGAPFVEEESLRWTRGQSGRPFDFLRFRHGTGEVISGEMPEEQDTRIQETLISPDVLAVNTLGQFAKHPRVTALREFITDWYLSYLTVSDTRGTPESVPSERLSATGDNLANVVQFLHEQRPEQLELIAHRLASRVPRLKEVITEPLRDGRLLMSFLDEPFDEPVLARFASDGTLKLLAYLIVLHDAHPPQLIGIEEPENYLHPRLLQGLADECREATARSQLLVTTHSPFFVNGLRPEEVWVLARDATGYTQARRASQLPGIKEFVQNGASLGDLWIENYFDFGDPLVGQSV